jgi:hypothetical protein
MFEKKDEFIIYHNLEKVYKKMEKLLDNFEFTSFENFINNSKLIE